MLLKRTTFHDWRNMSGSAARMQEELSWTRSSLRKCIRPLVRMVSGRMTVIRGCPSWLIATVMKDPGYAAVLGHAI